MPAKLKHGVIGCPGGKRKGAGRKPDWFREKCLSFLDDGKLLQFVADVGLGEEVEQVVTEAGQVIPCRAKVRDRLKAVEMIKEWAIGRETLPVALGGLSLAELIDDAEKQRGLA